MEACFLSSNSFTKAIELVPSMQARNLSHPKKKNPRFQSRKASSVGLPSSAIYCKLGSSSPQDEDKASVDADWRAFRARLVAGERAVRPEEGGPAAPSVAIGDKWTHRIHEPEKGCLLIATENLDGVHIFERTVVLLLATGPVGPTGIILNRPSLMSIKEIRSPALDSAAATFSDNPLFFGGPLEEGLFLMSPRPEDEEEFEKSGVLEKVMDGVYYGSKGSVGCVAEMVKRNLVGVGDFRFFDGYCGWETKQLRDEIRAGYWALAACSPSIIGLNGVGSFGLWEEIVGLMGPRKVW